MLSVWIMISSSYSLDPSCCSVHLFYPGKRFTCSNTLTEHAIDFNQVYYRRKVTKLDPKHTPQEFGAYIVNLCFMCVLTTSTASMRGSLTDRLPERLITQAGVSGVASISATTASIPNLLL